MNSKSLTPAQELAPLNRAHYPNESKEYRRARNELLAQEIELRRSIERVAALRRALPPGGEVTKAYEFIGEEGPRTLEQLFGKHSTLIVYSFMYGPQRKKPCPMCTSFMATWDKKLVDLEQRASVIFTARSPLERLLEYKRSRGWTGHRMYADLAGDFTRDYVSADDADAPAYTVFTRRDGKIRHFFSAEMSEQMADPGQDPRGAPDIDPLWTLLDTTPEGRGADWYPKLEY